MRTRVHSSSSLLPHSFRDADKFILHSRPRRVDHKPLSIAVNQSHVTFPSFFPSCSLSFFLPHKSLSLFLYFYLFYVLMLDVSCLYSTIINCRRYHSSIPHLIFIQSNFSACFPPIKLTFALDRSRLKILLFFKYDILRDSSSHSPMVDRVNRRWIYLLNRMFLSMRLIPLVLPSIPFFPSYFMYVK